MRIIAVDGNVHELSQSLLCAMPTEMVSAALVNIVGASLFCIPSRSWFLMGAFPRLRTPCAFPIPSLRLMQRMSQLVAVRGSDAECGALVTAAWDQIKRGGAPWSWYALDMPVLLGRCSAHVLETLLTYFTQQYKGARQYTGVI